MKEKFYDLLQEMVHYEVKELLQDPELDINTRIHNLQKYVNRVESRLGALDRRSATINRQLSNAGSSHRQVGKVYK